MVSLRSTSPALVIRTSVNSTVCEGGLASAEPSDLPVAQTEKGSTCTACSMGSTRAGRYGYQHHNVARLFWSSNHSPFFISAEALDFFANSKINAAFSITHKNKHKAKEYLPSYENSFVSTIASHHKGIVQPFA
jgi:hypothetical protein